MKKLPIFLGAYVVSIVALNLGFSYVPMLDLGFGMFSPMAVLAGVVFVLRDYGQREVGHYILLGMAAGALLSFALADPFVAYASVAAFVVSELADWVLYTVTKKPFYQRVILSSVVSTPIDTLVFLYLIDGVTVGTFVLMVAAKMVAAGAIWMVYRNKVEDEYDYAT
jgi:uncharacterized PurR-regulated membrane protein YhhQ (DUF165 family)